MITTVTLNAAIDKTYYVPKLQYGKVQRAARMHALPGGKGINVARVARQLGAEVTATGFVGGFNGRFIERELNEQGIVHDFVEAEGESRLCLNIMDESTGASTELLEPGIRVDATHLEKLRLKVAKLASMSRIVVFSGSLPQGVPAGYYAVLAEAARSQGAVVYLDTSGEALVNGVAAKPAFIKPNEDEISVLTGSPVQDEAKLLEAMTCLMAQGVGSIAVTLGEKGAVAGSAGRLYRVRIPDVEAVNPVGCGDAFVAGMATATARGAAFEEALRLAAASGTANVLTETAGNVRKDDVDRLLQQVVVEPIG